MSFRLRLFAETTLAERSRVTMWHYKLSQSSGSPTISNRRDVENFHAGSVSKKIEFVEEAALGCWPIIGTCAAGFVSASIQLTRAAIGPRHGDRVAEAQRNRPTCSGDLEKPPVGRARNPKTGW